MSGIFAAISGFFSAIINTIGAALSEFCLLFSAFLLGLILQIPNYKMVTDNDLTGYHAVGEVWQETYSYTDNFYDEGRESSVVLEFEFLESTVEYVKINIKLKSAVAYDAMNGEGVSFDFWYPYWETLVDQNGTNYETTKGKYDYLRYYPDIPINEDGITLYMYYSFNTKSPARYIKVEGHRQGNRHNVYAINIFPHE